MDHLDGNVLAGPATGFLAFEPTSAEGQCHVCADVATLGQAMVYGQPMGYVARCRNCENVILVIVEHSGRRYLDMRGLRWVQIAERTITNEITGPQP
jgi:hypothetical protein